MLLSLQIRTTHRKFSCAQLVTRCNGYGHFEEILTFSYKYPRNLAELAAHAAVMFAIIIARSYYKA